ncbi:MAG: outer membrane lipoprotein carrier protein LolA [Gemmatimonadales bacterium]|nr:outer membrane lipoprotein carrier protein LolA [Gemmatimonadales bacterium]
MRERLGLFRLATAGFLAAAALSTGTTPSLQAQDAQAIVGRSSRVYRSLASLSADFVQVIDNPMIDSAESKGTLIQAGTSKLSMRFTDPPGEAVVIDGEHVWVYTPSTVPGQVLRLAVPSGGPVYGYNLLAWLLDRPAERYTAKYLRQERVGTRAMDVVELTPSVPDLPFDRAVLWLDREDALPRRLEITEKSGALRTLALSKLRVNRKVPDSTFEFKAPSGVRVVDQ